jgi:hypothetical protein
MTPPILRKSIVLVVIESAAIARKSIVNDFKTGSPAAINASVYHARTQT